MENILTKSETKVSAKHLHSSEVLFVNGDGSPITFNILPSPDQDLIVQLIKEGGGRVTEGDSLENSGSIIISSGSPHGKNAEEVISSSYVYACYFNGELLDVEEFRFIPDNVGGNTSVMENKLHHDENCPEKYMSLEEVRNVLSCLKNCEWFWKEIEKKKVCGNKPWKTIQHNFSLWALERFGQFASLDRGAFCGCLMQDDECQSKNSSPVSKLPPDLRAASNAEPRVGMVSKKIDECVQNGNSSGPNEVDQSLIPAVSCKDVHSVTNVLECEGNVSSYLPRRKRIAGRTSAVIDDESASETEVHEVDVSKCVEREDVLPSTRSDCDKERGVHLEKEGNCGEEKKDQEGNDNLQVAHHSKFPSKVEARKRTRRNLFVSCDEWLSKDGLNSKWEKPDIVRPTPTTESSSLQDEKRTGAGSKTSKDKSPCATHNVKHQYHQRLYSYEEDKEILRWICCERKRSYDPLTGNRIWKYMESRNVIPDRSWQSLRERFRRHIAPNLKNYPIAKEDLKKLLREIRK